MGKYIDLIWEKVKQEVSRQKALEILKYGAFALAAIAMFRGVLLIAGVDITVSNSVNGRELPIYCVETEEKKIALSFDAAWGNDDTSTILEILKKHNIKVTFFMTGGWVDKWACMNNIQQSLIKTQNFKSPFVWIVR